MKHLIKFIKKVLVVLLITLSIVVIAGYFYLSQEQFGALPSGDRLKIIEKSPNYKEGKFRNKNELPTISKGYTMIGVLWTSLFKKFPRTEPSESLPSIKTDLKNLPNNKNWLVWFGHSSFLMQIDGVKILVDPVFSGNASPISGSVKSYKGTDIYSVEDMPEVDYLLISHDHYDHLDFETIKKINAKVKNVICGLGIGAHFERWGFSPNKILEKDWGDEVKINTNFSIHIERTHHNCARGLTRDKALWVSYVFKTSTLQLFYSGDGGYDNRFEEIYKKYGAMDWAIMEFGQYNEAWESVHELPKQVIKATEELHTKNMMPVHHSKFTLAHHPWDEPLKLATEYSQGKSYKLATPMIGEILWMNDASQQFKPWWVGIN